jgi:hypothetical protein
MDPKPTASKPLFPSNDNSPETPVGRSSGPRSNADRVDMTALIRSLQRADGQSPCFKTGADDCDRIDCPWRRYCL